VTTTFAIYLRQLRRLVKVIYGRNGCAKQERSDCEQIPRSGIDHGVIRVVMDVNKRQRSFAIIATIFNQVITQNNFIEELAPCIATSMVTVRSDATVSSWIKKSESLSRSGA
jgi:hypothetical protein